MGIEVYKPIENLEKEKNSEMNDFLDFDKDLENSFWNFLTKNKDVSPEERQNWFNKRLENATSKLDNAKDEDVENEVHGFKNKMRELGGQMKDLGKKLFGSENEIDNPQLNPNKFNPDFVKYFDNIDIQNKAEFIYILNNSEILPEMGMDFFKDYALKNIQTYNSSWATSSTQSETEWENRSENKNSKNILKLGEKMILGDIDPNKQYFSGWNVKIVWSRLIYMWSDNFGKEEITLIVLDQNKKEISKKIFVVDIVEESIDNTPEAVSSSGINPGDVEWDINNWL